MQIKHNWVWYGKHGERLRSQGHGGSYEYSLKKNCIINTLWSRILMVPVPKICHHTDKPQGLENRPITAQEYWNINDKPNCLPISHLRVYVCVWKTHYLACKSRCCSDMPFHFSARDRYELAAMAAKCTPGETWVRESLHGAKRLIANCEQTSTS